MTVTVQASVLVMLTDDPLIGRRLRQLAQENGFAVAHVTDQRPGAAGPDQPELPAAPEDGGGQPTVAVIDLHHPEALGLVRAWRARWPGALLAGFLAMPDRERWVAAQRAGCDLVVNRGALVPQLRDRLRHWPAQRAGAGRRRFPLFEAADVAGRLGLVFRTDESPAGPLAVYRVDGGLHAIPDRCPHAGAALSGGDIESTVVTCPGHGSQFDVTTGDRLRGPADTGLPCYQLLEDRGQVFLVIREHGPPGEA
ncbi:MAG TPA: Rieske 2Fe-2S domain-containing protein [Streptosporangiaceae bacterium]|nr:Rieske 2Fe-2S domain-containing protein [Streptosporangiaceae bacterium]